MAMCPSYQSIPSPAIPVPGTATAVKTNVAKHISLLLDVIRSQRWSAFEHVALSKPNVFLLLSNFIPTYEEYKGMTLLHACLGYEPPIPIVTKILLMLPDRKSALLAQDQMGRTPIHIAAACNANPVILKLLGNIEPIACNIQDKHGRTPLHMACGCFHIKLQDKTGITQSRENQLPSSAAVCALLSESLTATTVEDNDGISALEYAIISGASTDLVRLMQRVTRQEIKKAHKKLRLL